MKKLLLLALAAVVSMPAATITLASNIDLSAGAFVIGNVGAINPGPNAVLNNVFLTAIGTWNSPTNPNTVYNITFEFGEGSSQITGSNLSGVASGAGSADTGVLSNAASANNGITNLLAFTVIGTISGSPRPADLRGSIFLNYDIVSTSGVPEPSTMALLGSSLVGLAALVRRRK